MFDHLGNTYPSQMGALEQILEILGGEAKESSYHFEAIATFGTDTAMFSAISFDELGEEDKMYIFKVFLEDEVELPNVFS